MKLLIILAAIVEVIVAEQVPIPSCESCSYNMYGIGYLPSNTYCNQFYKCQLNPSDGLEKIVMCCPDGSSWDELLLTCVPSTCHPSDPTYSNVDCPIILTPSGSRCNLLPHSTPEKYNRIAADGSLQEMDCEPDTHYEPAHCTCEPGELHTCKDDPLVYFPFATHTNDIQCMHAKGIRFGQAFVDRTMGALCLDGDGDYVEVPFFTNWFTQFKGTFTVSLWFYQQFRSYADGLPAGLFSNGDCYNNPSVYIDLGDHLTNVGFTAEIKAASPIFIPESYYGNAWNHIAIRYEPEPGSVTLFINGVITETIGTLGVPIMNSHAPVTIGMAPHCDDTADFLTGYIDDVMFFDRYVDDTEMYTKVYSRRRTFGPSEEPYL